MTETKGTAVSATTEVVAVKRGRKPGQLIWTHDKMMERITLRVNMIDTAKLEWLNNTYGPELSPLQVMILANHSKANEFWTASDEFKAVTAKTAELKAEADAAKAAADLKSATSAVTVETLMAALTPDQIAAIIAAATAAK